MSKQTKHVYEFGAFRVDAGQGLLTREGEVIPLAPKAFDILLVLVQGGGLVIPKEELMTRVWPDSFVEETNISRNIFTLRQALGDQYIETVPKRGYRFVGPVTQPSLEDGESLILEERSRSRIIVQEQEDLQESDPPQVGLESPVALPVTPLPRRSVVSRRQLAVAGVALIALAAVAFYFRTMHQPASAPIRSIAVLPFKPITRTGHGRYLDNQAKQPETDPGAFNRLCAQVQRPWARPGIGGPGADSGGRAGWISTEVGR